MKKNNFLRNLSITTLAMCGLSIAAGITGQAALPEGFRLPVVRSDDGSEIEPVLKNREEMTATVVDGKPNKDGELDIPKKVSTKYGEFTITEIGDGAFSNRDDITAVKIPSTVESINSSFNNCSNLKYVNLPFEFFGQVDSTAIKNVKSYEFGFGDGSLHDWVKEKKSKS